jgi:hypothetical protein
MIADALLPELQRLFDTDELHRAAMVAGERARFETIELVDRLELNTRAAAIAFEMTCANIVVAVPTMRHLKNLSWALAPFWRP